MQFRLAFGRLKPVTVARLILAMSVGLSVYASIAVPLFEGADEVEHYRYVRYIVTQRAFPATASDTYEYHQPPLYYLLGAGLSFWVKDHEASAAILGWNASVGYPFGSAPNDNRNVYLHSAQEALPYRGDALRVHLVRMLSVALTLGTLVTAWQLIAAVAGQDSWRAVSAFALVALNPALIVMGGMINNDNLITFTGSLFLLLCLRMLQSPKDYRTWLLAGVLWGLALLSKMTAVLFSLSLAVLLYIIWRQTQDWKLNVGAGAVVAASAFILAGPWILRNITLYGDPTAAGHLVGNQSGAPDWARGISLFPWTFTSYWDRFGWGYVFGPDWAHFVYGALCVGGLLGWIYLAWRPEKRKETLGGHEAEYLVAAFTVAVFLGALFVNSTLSNTAINPQGRFLFPVAGAIALLIAAGIGALIPERHSSTVMVLITGGLAALAAWLVMVVLPGAYARPPVVRASTFDSGKIQFLSALSYGNAMRLRGYSLAEQAVHPGENLEVTFYWEPVGPISDNYLEFMQVIAPPDVQLASRATHTGLGNFPTSQWSPGTIVVDTISVPIESNAAAPGFYQLHVGFLDPTTGDRLPVADAAGQAVETAAIGWVRVTPRSRSKIEGAAPIHARFGGVIELAACGIEQDALRLQWRAIGQIAEDYSVFVHFFDASNHLVGQADHVPNQGLFPTSAWRAGDDFVETIPIPKLDAKVSRVRIGFYSLVTGDRLGAASTAGEPIRDDAVDLPEECTP